ncbi:MAG: hypothetical protein COB38_07060 [Gammaproteobacteria bacterium]|nr:MAG: hypothetical protein COB38_07060 [Gammaproteobacteria bacterium]
MTTVLKYLGVNLKKSRKNTYPDDTIAAFSVRCEIGLSTYKKMEKGDLTVALNYYYLAAEVLGSTSEFEDLFRKREDWFND